MRSKIIIAVVIAACLLLCAAFAFLCPLRLEKPDEYTVYATCFPVYAVCDMVLKDIPGLKLEMLLQPQADDLSAYSLSDWDIALLDSADVAVFAGSGLESFSEYWSNEKTIIVKLLSGLVLSRTNEKLEILANNEEADLSGVNPWLFMSPEGFADMAEALCANMLAIDEEYSKEYYGNLSNACERISVFSSECEDMLKDCDLNETVAITHEGLMYLCEQLGLNAVLLCEDPDVQILKERGIKTVLADENTYYAIHSVLETNGIKVACLDMLISHTKEESYFELMRKNVSEIANVLKTGI